MNKDKSAESPTSDSSHERVFEEFAALPLPTLTARDVRIPDVPGMAAVFVGMRRTGKSYLMFQEMRRLLDAGVPRSSLLYLNLEDDRLGAVDGRTLDAALEYLFRNGPERHVEPAFVFLDEIQSVPDWERFVLRVLNTEKARVCLTGSSAKLLSTEVATSLRGRSTAVEVLPFSFREFLRHRGSEELAAPPVGAAARSKLEAAAEEYLLVGGFPAVQGMELVDRRRTLQDYVDLVTFRDVVERWDVGNLVALQWLIAHLSSTFSREFSVNRIHNDLKSQGVSVGKDTLHAYLGHLIDARLVYAVAIRRSSYRARMVNPRKAYLVDPGLARAVAAPSADDTGHLLENTVYLELRRRFGRLHEEVVSYYSDGEGGAVDFVVDDGEGDPMLIQVCARLTAQQTRDREIHGLATAMRTLGVRRGTIVTLRDTEQVEIDEGSIEVIPAWRWLLEDE